MTKETRAKLITQGKVILRARMNRKETWEIVKYTANGGWKKVKEGFDWFITREECESYIDAIVFSSSTAVKDA